MQRKHTTTACQVCRDNKIKCDGVRPVCGSCDRKGKVCEYSVKDDKRKISFRAAVEVLMGHIGNLTNLALSHGLSLPAMSPQDERMVEQVCDNMGLPLSHILPPGAAGNPTSLQNQSHLASTHVSNNVPTQLDQGQQILETTDLSMQDHPLSAQGWPDLALSDGWEGSPSDWSWQMLNDFSAFPSLNFNMMNESFMTNPMNNVNQPGDEGNGDPPESSNTSDDEAEADIVPRLAARLGGLRPAEDGRLRYYGTASNHHFLSNSSLQVRTFDVKEMQRNATIALKHAQLNQEIPGDLQDHFIKLFFDWHNPCHSTVDKTVFMASLQRSPEFQTEYCSPSLIAAMCAIGAASEGRYHHSLITFPKSVSEFFADKSKILLEIELDSPCVSTVQTLLLLSSHETACGRDVRTWLYSGMAMRLSFDIGLHVDNEPYVTQGLFTAQEAEARRCAFWSSVVINLLWSFSLGRPFRVDSEELTVKPPGSSTPFGSAPVGMNTAALHNGLMVQLNPETNTDIAALVASQWVSLCNELAPLIRVLYGCAKISKVALQQLSMQTSTRLLNWENQIPDSIKVSQGQPAPPEVLLLHMGYHNMCILVHRPWTSKGSHPRSKTGAGIGPGYRHAREVCRNSASKVASLVRQHEITHGLRTMHVYAVTIISSASLILIFGLIAEEWPDETEKQTAAWNLNTCFRALDELGQCFESAKSTHEHLLAIQKHWAQKRRDAEMDGSRFETSKRKMRSDNWISSSGTASKRSKPP